MSDNSKIEFYILSSNFHIHFECVVERLAFIRNNTYISLHHANFSQPPTTRLLFIGSREDLPGD